MIFTPTELPDAAIIDVERHGDERGFLARTYCEREFADHGISFPVVQSSTIYSPQRGTLRGLHFQRDPHSEAKLVRCTRGSIYVVIVDLRPQSPKRQGWVGLELSTLNQRLLYVPNGFAQGYQTLADETEVLYHMTPRVRARGPPRGVRWNDPALRHLREPPAEDRLISERDKAWPDYTGPATAV